MEAVARDGRVQAGEEGRCGADTTGLERGQEEEEHLTAISESQYGSMLVAILAMVVYFVFLASIYQVSNKYTIRSSILAASGVDASTLLKVKDRVALWAWVMTAFSKPIGYKLDLNTVGKYNMHKMDRDQRPFVGTEANRKNIILQGQGYALSERNVFVTPAVISQQRRGYVQQPDKDLAVTPDAVAPSSSTMDFKLLPINVYKGPVSAEEILDSISMEQTFDVPVVESLSNITEMTVILNDLRLQNAFDHDIILEHDGIETALLAGFNGNCAGKTHNCSEEDSEFTQVNKGYNENPGATSMKIVEQRCRQVCSIFTSCLAQSTTTIRGFVEMYCGTSLKPDMSVCRATNVVSLCCAIALHPTCSLCCAIAVSLFHLSNIIVFASYM